MKIKKIKNFGQMPQPYINFVDPDAKSEFLEHQYSSRVSMFRRINRDQGFEAICDLSNLEAYMDAQEEDVLSAGYKEIAFVGRSNVGKSTLINSIVDANILKCSKTPGKTQNLHFINIPELQCQLVDCPGYGFAKASNQQKEQWKKFMMQYLMNSRFLHRCVMLVDLKAGLLDSDKLLIDMLTDMQKVFMIVLTKADKVKAGQIQEKSETVTEYAKRSGSLTLPVIHCVSA